MAPPPGPTTVGSAVGNVAAEPSVRVPTAAGVTAKNTAPDAGATRYFVPVYPLPV